MRRKSSAPGQLVRVVASFLCGYLTATVFDFTSLTNWVNTHFSAMQNKPKQDVQTAVKERELPKPKFEFYTLLAKDGSASNAAPRTVAAAVPTQVRPIAQATVSAPAPTPVTQVASTTVISVSKPVTIGAANINKESYLIQIASFKNRQDAERLKATLTLKGFDVSISSSLQQQVNWFRVLVGPFNSRSAAEKMRLNLAQNERINGMIRRMDA